LAQVLAIFGYMFPGRIFLGLGRGESLNEIRRELTGPQTKRGSRGLRKQSS
jgi:hypothetical protein